MKRLHNTPLKKYLQFIQEYNSDRYTRITIYKSSLSRVYYAMVERTIWHRTEITYYSSYTNDFEL